MNQLVSLAVCSLLLAAVPQASAAPMKVALVPFAAGEGVTEKTAAALTEVTAAEIRRVPDIQLTTEQEISALLSFDRQRSMLGCSNDSCLAEIGGALGVARLTVGTLNRLGESWLINLKLVDVKRARTVSQADRRLRGGTIDDVLDALPGLVAEAFGRGAAPVATVQTTSGSTSGTAPASSSTPATTGATTTATPPASTGTQARPGRAQEPIGARPKNLAYFELGGTMLLGSANYHRVLKSTKSGADVGVKFSLGLGGAALAAISLGSDMHRAEFELGLAKVIAAPWAGAATVGYRYTTPKGLILRASFTPAFALGEGPLYTYNGEEFKWLPMLGLSAGYAW